MVVRETIEQALSFIPADDRDIWIKCGMAIKTEMGDAGLEICDRWSATADSYRARDAAASWRSFKASGAVRIGTLFHIAKQYGYQRQSSSSRHYRHLKRLPNVKLGAKLKLIFLYHGVWPHRIKLHPFGMHQ